MNHKLPIAQSWAYNGLSRCSKVSAGLKTSWSFNSVHFHLGQGRDSAAPIVCVCRRACRPIRVQAAFLDERLVRKVIKGVGVFSSFVFYFCYCLAVFIYFLINTPKSC